MEWDRGGGERILGPCTTCQNHPAGGIKVLSAFARQEGKMRSLSCPANTMGWRNPSTATCCLGSRVGFFCWCLAIVGWVLPKRFTVVSLPFPPSLVKENWLFLESVLSVPVVGSKLEAFTTPSRIYGR